MSTATFVVTEEQQLLRETAAKYLAARSTSERVRELMATDTGFDPDEWREVAGMGWTSLAVPERLGGAGYGWTEVGVLAEEMGRSLWCAPWLSSAVLATAALLAVGGEVADELVGQLASGERRATLAHQVGHTDVRHDGSTVTGTARFVLDGGTADVLLVPAAGPDGPVLLAVERGAEGVTTASLPTLDLTRKQADVTFEDAAATVVATGHAADAAVDHAVTVAAVVQTAEQVGGTAKVLADSVEYGRSRMQFGRAIGSYQALKHRMADTLKELEAARSAAYHAVRTLDGDDLEERAIAAGVAVSFCSEVYERATGANIQNQGGIGFTWEADAHLWFKRAKASKLLFGGPRAWREMLADVLEL